MNILNLQGISTDKIINPLGQLGVVSQQEKLLQNMVTLLMTQKGSLLGNPDYGSRLHEYLFETSSDTMLSSVKKEIRSVIETNYNSLNNLEIDTEIKENGLYVTLNYTTLNSDLSSAMEFTIPIGKKGGIRYE